MSKQRYLLARFLKDVRRQEPRNIGVILWTPNKVACRFLSADEARSLGVEEKLYVRWTRFWSETCRAGSIDMGRKGRITRSTPTFLDAIMQSQRGNYRLAEAGYVKESIVSSEVDNVVTQLFVDLVATSDAAGIPHAYESRTTLSQACKSLFSSAGLLDDPMFVFRETSRVPCRIGKARREFPINYRLGDEKRPVALYHRVNLGDERSVDSASYMFEWLVKSGQVAGKEKCGALFDNSTGAQAIAGAETQLAEHSVAINVTNRRRALGQVQGVAYGTAG